MQNWTFEVKALDQITLHGTGRDASQDAVREEVTVLLEGEARALVVESEIRVR